MAEYYQKFEVRWSDVDANRHLANTAYVQYASHTRLSFLSDHGFGQKEFAAFNIGPAAVHEEMYFFKEAHFRDDIYIGLELSGMSTDGKYFMFYQPMYLHNGKNIAVCLVKGTWIDLVLRKSKVPPKALMYCMQKLPRSKDFRIIEKSDLRDSIIAPNHLDRSLGYL